MNKTVSEVEEILREIRVRVQHESLANTQIERRVAAESAVDFVAVEEFHADSVPPAPDPVHLNAHLATIERTRKNLPPVISNRSGLVARTELFVKRQIKRMTKWFTYDQLIFNTAVYETLVEQQKMLASCSQQLSSCVQEQARLRQLLVDVSEKQKLDTSADIGDLRSDIEKRLGQLDDQQTVIYKNLLIQIRESSQVVDESRRGLEERLTAIEDERRSA